MSTIDEMAVAALDQWLDHKFTSLYRDLCDAFPHPFEWTCLLHERPWWQFRARKAQRQVAMIFAQHGILLTDHSADHYMKICRNHPQRYDEDCGGANVRQLRAAFGYAFIGPFAGMFEVEHLVEGEQQ